MKEEPVDGKFSSEDVQALWNPKVRFIQSISQLDKVKMCPCLFQFLLCLKQLYKM